VRGDLKYGKIDKSYKLKLNSRISEQCKKGNKAWIGRIKSQKIDVF
jgi:hypothetical protein